MDIAKEIISLKKEIFKIKHLLACLSDDFYSNDAGHLKNENVQNLAKEKQILAKEIKDISEVRKKAGLVGHFVRYMNRNHEADSADLGYLKKHLDVTALLTLNSAEKIAFYEKYLFEYCKMQVGLKRTQIDLSKKINNNNNFKQN